MMVRFWVHLALAFGLLVVLISNTVRDTAAVAYLAVCVAVLALTAVWSFVDDMR